MSRRISSDPLTHSPTGSLAKRKLDAILLTRGGGSLEDLWCFNEEAVARAITASAVPVIAAIGHEIDFTIADFVADLRAATPSAAAELLTQNYVNSRGFVNAVGPRLGQLARQRLEWAREESLGLGRRFQRGHPRRRLEAWSQRLDDFATALLRIGRGATKPQHLRLAGLTRRLAALKPAAAIARQRRLVGELGRRLAEAGEARLAQRRTELARLNESLRLLSPLNVLERGYSITLDAATGAVVRDATKLKAGQELRTRLANGEVDSFATAFREAGRTVGTVLPVSPTGPSV